MAEKKTIKIKPEVHGRLIKIGNKAETFSHIIDDLINYYQGKEKRDPVQSQNSENEE